MADRPEGRTLILMIDDDRKLCRLVSTYLEPLGFSVTAVHTGPEGAERATAADARWHAVLLDVMLPGIDGFEVLRRIRQPLDNAVAQTRDWAKAHGDDTLILVLADHNHPNSLVGTINDDMSQTPNVALRERVGVYEKAGFPNYPAPDAEGYPARIDVSRRLAIFSASLPDHYETYRPKLDGPNDPFKPGSEPGTFVGLKNFFKLWIMQHSIQVRWLYTQLTRLTLTLFLQKIDV